MKEIKTTKGTFIFIPNNEPIVYNNTLYKIISTTKDITEEQIESIVEKKQTEGSDIFGIGYSYYVDYTDKDNTLLEEAKESLQSLMKSNGLSLENNYLILKKTIIK